MLKLGGKIFEILIVVQMEKSNVIPGFKKRIIIVIENIVTRRETSRCFHRYERVTHVVWPRVRVCVCVCIAAIFPGRESRDWLARRTNRVARGAAWIQCGRVLFFLSPSSPPHLVATPRRKCTREINFAVLGIHGYDAASRLLPVTRRDRNGARD